MTFFFLVEDAFFVAGVVFLTRVEVAEILVAFVTAREERVAINIFYSIKNTYKQMSTKNKTTSVATMILFCSRSALPKADRWNRSSRFLVKSTPKQLVSKTMYA